MPTPVQLGIERLIRRMLKQAHQPAVLLLNVYGFRFPNREVYQRVREQRVAAAGTAGAAGRLQTRAPAGCGRDAPPPPPALPATLPALRSLPQPLTQLFVLSFFLLSPQSVENQVQVMAQFYGLPQASLRAAAWRRMLEGGNGFDVRRGRGAQAIAEPAASGARLGSFEQSLRRCSEQPGS